MERKSCGSQTQQYGVTGERAGVGGDGNGQVWILQSLENPAYSYLWSIQGVVKWLAGTRGEKLITHYCPCHTEPEPMMLKPTGIAFSEVQTMPEDVQQLFLDLAQRCSRKHRRPHTKLNTWKTADGCPYPRALTDAWALAVTRWWDRVGQARGLPKRALELFSGDPAKGGSRLTASLRQYGWEVIPLEILVNADQDILDNDVFLEVKIFNKSSNLLTNRILHFRVILIFRNNLENHQIRDC